MAEFLPLFEEFLVLADDFQQLTLFGEDKLPSSIKELKETAWLSCHLFITHMTK